METLIQLIILFASITLAFGDVSHFFFPESNLFQQPTQQQLPHNQYLYTHNPVQPQSPVGSTTEFFLPEIISNRRFKDQRHNQGNFIPLNHYLPPAVNNDVHHLGQSPSLSYLPPKTDKPIVVLDETPSVSQGYDYNTPSTSTANPNDEEPSLQFPSALLPASPEIPFFVDEPQSGGIPTTTSTTTTHNPNQGYFYEAPGTTFQDDPLVFQDAGTDGKSPQVRLHVHEMRCLDHTKGLFRAVLKIESFLNTIPTIENYSNDPKCSVKLNRNLLVINIEAENFQKCGIHYCGKELCLRLRFPSIRGIRTSSDSLLVLRCKTQTRVAAKTHALKMRISNDIQARKTDVYAHGGVQNEFRTHIELLRRTVNGFSKKLETNDVVRLGEELLLRAHVGPGDGWNYTKLTDVNLQQISQSGDLTRSVNLITSNGCVNPSMRSICPQSPIFEPPLGHRFLFKAVMFQEMRSGEEMVLSMKVTGCLEQNDCHINIQDCNNGNLKRQRRNTPRNISTDFSEFPSISFRVAMPISEEGAEVKEENASLSLIMAKRWMVFVILAVIGVLSLLALIILCIVRKKM